MGLGNGAGLRSDERVRKATLSLVCTLLFASSASATPGPDTTVVIGNANVPESVALAERYAAARSLPSGQVCLLDVPDVEDIDLADYEAMFLAPLRDCLDRTSGTLDRIEAALLIRGVPLRVNIPVGSETRTVSLAAALNLWNSNQLGVPLLGQAPGMVADCGGTPCYAAVWRNPYRGFPFESGWSVERDGIDWRPILVTMLHGRSYEDAESLLDSALAAEAAAPPTGEMLFMEGRDPARGALDVQYDRVILELTTRGFLATRVPFDADLTGRTLSSFVTGSAAIGTTIEGNTYRPGTLVDNLTSFGAVPQNFRDPPEESQVSIARWVAMGVAGVHGTVAEPLNNVFPNRFFLVAYVDGATLAEAYFGVMPNVYWMNLVLGDPMTAPHAVRPELSVTGVSEGATLSTGAPVSAIATDDRMRGISSIVAYVDGVEIARSDDSAALDFCLSAAPGEHQLLIVARAADDPTGAHPWMPKGWVAYTFSDDGPSPCLDPDGGRVPDDATIGLDGGSSDGGTAPMTDGCSCRATGGTGRAPLSLLVIGVWVVLGRRR